MTARPSPGAKDLAGKRLGPYTLVKHLDTGGMAEIFLARHEGRGGFRKDLVVKMLQPRYASNKQVLEMFFDEARLAAKLSHPSICEVFDVGEEDGTHFIAMEYIEGKTIADLVRRGIEVGNPLPLPYAAQLVSHIAEGLSYMFDGRGPTGDRFGIVHRDISPTNILVGSAGQARIIDFGVATDRSARKEEETGRPGKYSYMSPEQVKGEVVDGRSDIFSLGIILYEITLNRRLYRGPAPQVMKRIVDEPLRPPTFVARDYPPALEHIVMRALEKRPQDRYETADDLCRDLEEFLTDSHARVGNRHIALYLQAVDSPDAEVSEKGVRRARAFIEGDDEIEDEDDLDLDFQAKETWRQGPVAEPLPARAVAEVAVSLPELPVPIVAKQALPPAPAEPNPAAPAATPADAKSRGRAATIFMLGALCGAAAGAAALRLLGG